MTSLPESYSLYGLGEHTDPFMLNTRNYIRTLWSRDAYTVPPGTNSYGNHQIYFDNRNSKGTHGVFLLKSNGMDIFLNSTAETGQYLEYNTLGGIGSVSGSLYLDDGDSLIQPTTSYLHFLYAHGKLNMTGIFRYDASVSIASVTVLDTGSNGTKTTTDIKLTGAQKNIHV
ncbi:hypothetical protein B0A54_16578 [Friedmanniomyces endolithicus]|uniref:Glycoside hydrolase family 31 N-terminal domain-containing protein n=1 Tax=Friedmanniomyces endolithicus TaxID=329885 RepID=A0A4U0U9E7_9PEZI|nr:hypothetical protein B0A54_16578 [Friedmanniomyces endolithicus]